MSALTGKRVALVLGAGGARGLAHIGVLEVLQKHGVIIEAVVGCSMGSLVGGIFAAGKLDDYRDWTCALERAHVLRLLDFNFGLPGLIRGDRVIGALRELVGDHDIEDLPMAFTAVATDLETQREAWLNRGKLFDAVRASIAIPMLFTPHVVDGRELVDGGLLAPLPIAPTRLHHVDHVIAVDVNGPVSWRLAEVERARIASLWSNWRGGSGDVTPSPRKRSMLDLMARSLDTMQAHLTRMHLAQDPPDLLIQVPSNICAIYEYWRSREMIDIGREAAERAVARFG